MPSSSEFSDLFATIAGFILVLVFCFICIYVVVKALKLYKENAILQNKKLRLEIADLERKALYYERKGQDN